MRIAGEAQLRLTRPVEFPSLETMSRKNRSPAKAHPKKPALATEYFKFQEPGVWFIIGSGAMFGGPNGIRMHPKLHRILNALSAAGIKYDQKSSGSAGNCDSYTFSAAFDGGTLSVVTGNYWFGSRGGTSYKAANWILAGLTQGRGKLEKQHQQACSIKQIWLYPIHPHFRNILCA